MQNNIPGIPNSMGERRGHIKHRLNERPRHYSGLEGTTTRAGNDQNPRRTRSKPCGGCSETLEHLNTRCVKRNPSQTATRSPKQGRQECEGDFGTGTSRWRGSWIQGGTFPGSLAPHQNPKPLYDDNRHDLKVVQAIQDMETTGRRRDHVPEWIERRVVREGSPTERAGCVGRGSDESPR